MNNAQVYGKSSTDGIVAVEADGDQVTRWRRDPGSGDLYTDTDAFFPMLWVETAGQADAIRRDSRGVYDVVELSGDLQRKYLILFKSMDGFFSAFRALKQRAGLDEYLPEWCYVQTDDTQMYLMQSGETLFGGLRGEDLLRMNFDIETRTSGGMPDPYRYDDEVLIISVSTNRGGEWVLHLGARSGGPYVPCSGEKQMLRRFVKLVRETDPDVVVGHNVHDFDLDYLRRRTDFLGVGFGIGRDGSEPRHYSTAKRAAQRYLDYECHDIAGRHVIDTMFAAYDWNVYARELDSFGLKGVAKTLGLAAGGEGERTYLDMSNTNDLWDSRREEFLDYALDDVRETDAIYKELTPALFEKAKIVPLGFGTLNQCGTGREIEGLMTREYLRQSHSLPRPEQKKDYPGGYTKLYQQGVYGIDEGTKIYNYDVASLYPYCQIGYECYPESDRLGVMGSMLEALTEKRIAIKEEMRAMADEDPRKSVLDAQQAADKVLINSFYGVEGAPSFLFNDMDAAEEIVMRGRDVLRRMNTLVAEQGHTLVECDTDGVWALNDGDGLEGAALAEHITEEMPGFIDIDVDACLDGMAMYRTKNYCKQPDASSPEDLSFKGSAMTSSMFEVFGREFIQTGFGMMLEGEIEALHEMYITYCERIAEHDIPVEKLVKRETLRESVADYREKLESEEHGRTADARYELVQEYDYLDEGAGSQIVYYNAGELTSEPVYKVAKPVREYAGDENEKYYIRKRMQAFAKKFEPFFSEEDFAQMFPRPDRGEILPERRDVSSVMLVQRAVGKLDPVRGDLEA